MNKRTLNFSRNFLGSRHEIAKGFKGDGSAFFSTYVELFGRETFRGLAFSLLYTNVKTSVKCVP